MSIVVAQSVPPLRSPYPQQMPVSGQHAFACPVTPTPIVQLATNSIYSAADPKRATINPAARQRYLAKIAPVRSYAKQLVKLANNYRQHALPAFGHCALRWLNDWAVADALSQMDSLQANLGRGPLLSSLALSYLQLNELPGDHTAERVRIENWLARLATDSINFIESRPNAPSSSANHRYWNGLGVAAAGIAANRRDLFDWGMDSYRLGIEQIEVDGALPLELKRGKRARDYHFYAVAPLVMLAELGAANQLDLYAARDGALHRLVQRVIESLQDAAYFETRAGVKQVDFPEGGPPPNRLAWLEPYLARFPNTAWEQQIASRRPLAATKLGGNLTLLFGSEVATVQVQGAR
ncbi:MAG: hypothetical protein HC808_19295 [Candidatus Competibacteraceae bacterium]|nr:hypothetical protein [Candidatus Competibacteraceae bacterium]